MHIHECLWEESGASQGCWLWVKHHVWKDALTLKEDRWNITVWSTMMFCFWHLTVCHSLIKKLCSNPAHQSSNQQNLKVDSITPAPSSQDGWAKLRGEEVRMCKLTNEKQWGIVMQPTPPPPPPLLPKPNILLQIWVDISAPVSSSKQHRDTPTPSPFQARLTFACLCSPATEMGTFSLVGANCWQSHWNILEMQTFAKLY